MKKHIDINSLKHIGVCAAGSFLGLYGVAVVSGSSVTKEWCDGKKKNGHWCWWDIASDCVGIAIGIALHRLVFGSWGTF